MTDLILPYVDRLLQLDKGNKDTLLKIQRACQQNEILSISERDYVAKLAKQYLGNYTDPYATVSTSVPSTPPQPIVSQPASQSIPRTRNSTMQIHKTKSKLPIVKIGIVLGILCAIGIIGAVVALNNPISNVDVIITPPSIIPTDDRLPVSLDQSTYNRGDIISVYGTAITPTVTITVSTQDVVVWSEIVNVYDDKFSTLLIAGSPNWSNSGVYTVGVLANTTQYTLNFDYVN